MSGVISSIQDMTKKKIDPPLTKEALLEMLRKEKRPLAFGELIRLFVAYPEQKRELKTIIHEMLKTGSVVRLKNGRFGIPQEMNLRTGILWCTKSGNGFVVTEKEEERDIFIPARSIEDAFHGDKVIVRIDHSFRGRKEGKIIKVTERRMRNVVGFLRKTNDLFFLIPEDERISRHFIVARDSRYTNLEEGDLVACKVIKFPENGGDPRCRIVHVFKGLDDVKSINQFVTYKYNLPQRFKRTVEIDAKNMGLETNDEDRVDLTALKHVTIDGEFAKDFDDAVYIEKTKNGYTLYVSIADVSHYVTPGSGLDHEAYQRGTSIYFPGSVIPMLPNVLSNELCSLKPRENRLTITAKLAYDKHGVLLGSSFHRSVIRSAMRLTYTKVEATLVGRDREVRRELKDVLRTLEEMGELAALLAERRAKRESLDFDLPEPEVILDIEGGIKEILRAERLFSHRLIEEFMIGANEAVAAFFAQRNIPALYRIHEAPEKEKLRDFERLLHTLSIEYRRNSRGLPLQAILASVQGEEYEFLVNRVLLRSMKQAKYSAVNTGHFGLASENYLHFTSPIRRYPDLICHRILKQALRNPSGIAKLQNEKARYDQKELEKMAVHLSERERLAMEAERELEDRIRVLFMKERVGETYEGIISHITSYGFFVELFDIFVEGVVLLSTIYDDYYTFQEEKFRLIGRRTKKTYRIGDKVRIKVEMADIEKNQLHFVLI